MNISNRCLLIKAFKLKYQSGINKIFDILRNCNNSVVYKNEFQMQLLIFHFVSDFYKNFLSSARIRRKKVNRIRPLIRRKHLKLMMRTINVKDFLESFGIVKNDWLKTCNTIVIVAFVELFCRPSMVQSRNGFYIVDKTDLLKTFLKYSCD